MLFVVMSGSGVGVVLFCVCLLLGRLCFGCVAMFAMCLGLVWFVLLLLFLSWFGLCLLLLCVCVGSCCCYGVVF